MGRTYLRSAVHPRGTSSKRRSHSTFLASGTIGFLLLASVSALADAPNPTSSTRTAVTNANGSITVTASGTWTWLNSRGCDRPTGYAIDWNDPLQPGNIVGTLNGVTYDVGALMGNTFNPADNVIHPTESCSMAGGRANGTWGPISHTYASGTVFPVVTCAVTYDNKGGTAGGPGHQSDNSVEENNNAPGSDGCSSIAPPSKLAPTIMTVSAPTGNGVTPGESVRDTATVSGPTGGVAPTGTVSFYLCGPGAVTAAGCPTGGTPIGNAVALSSGSATSSATSDTDAIGDHCWRAEYSGDANYLPGSHTNRTSECFTIGKLAPEITTVPKPAAADVGDPIYDTATVTGGSYPTGVVVFELFGPGDADCSAAPVYVDSAPLVGGRATSDTFTPDRFGRYRWIATYSGDARHASATHGCQAEVVLINEVLGELIPNLPTTGVASRSLQLFGLLLMSMGAVLVPTLLRSRRVDTIIERRPPKR